MHVISLTFIKLYQWISGVLKQVIFLQDDIIYKCDMEGTCMYFIITGTVAMVSYSGKEVCTFILQIEKVCDFVILIINNIILNDGKNEEGVDV